MKTVLASIFLVLSINSFSQSGPAIKQGSTLIYLLVSNEGSLPITIKVDSLASGYTRFAWSAPNQGNGTWVLKQKSLDNANSGLWSQLEPDRELLLMDNQSVVVFSKAQWAGMQKDKKTEFDGVKFYVKSNPQALKLNDKSVDALYLESDNAASKVWVLNNPAFPAILKIVGNTAGPDIELKSID